MIYLAAVGVAWGLVIVLCEAGCVLGLILMGGGLGYGDPVQESTDPGGVGANSAYAFQLFYFLVLFLPLLAYFLPERSRRSRVWIWLQVLLLVGHICLGLTIFRLLVTTYT